MGFGQPDRITRDDESFQNFFLFVRKLLNSTS